MARMSPEKDESLALALVGFAGLKVTTLVGGRMYRFVEVLKRTDKYLHTGWGPQES